MLALPVVLVVNDHVLNKAFPGVMTGKLSDVAGLMVLPPLLDMAIRNAKAAIAITGIGSTLVKATATGAWRAHPRCGRWGGTLGDPHRPDREALARSPRSGRRGGRTPTRYPSTRPSFSCSSSRPVPAVTATSYTRDWPYNA